jgi:hypothetical protein
MLISSSVDPSASSRCAMPDVLLILSHTGECKFLHKILCFTFSVWSYRECVADMPEEAVCETVVHARHCPAEQATVGSALGRSHDQAVYARSLLNVALASRHTQYCVNEVLYFKI